MQRITGWIAAHRKALAGYLGLAMTVLTAVSQAQHWHLTWLPLLGAAAAALGVHLIPNTGPAAPGPKA